jgi:hypothetical protein
MSSGVAPGVGLGLHLHAQHAALAHEVVDVGHAQRGLQHIVEVGEVHAQRARLEPVDIEEDLRPGLLAFGPHADQHRVLPGEAQRHVARFEQLVAAEAAAVLQAEVEAADRRPVRGWAAR